jgi:hypothetical protein
MSRPLLTQSLPALEAPSSIGVQGSKAQRKLWLQLPEGSLIYVDKEEAAN